MAWYARKKPGHYQIAWREPGTRKQRYKSFRTLDAARRWKSDTEARIDRGEYSSLDSRKMPLGRYMDLVLGAGDLAPSTLGAYSYRRTHTAALERLPIGDITTAHVRDLMGRLEQAGLGAPGRSSVRKLLMKVFSAAIRDGILVRNPVEPVPNPRSDRREIQVYSPQEIAALAEAIGQGLGPAVLLSAYGGLRSGEVAGLRVQDVGWLTNTVSVVQAVQLVRGRAVLAEPKTKGSRRTVNVPPFVMEALNVEGEAHVRPASQPSPSTLLFQRPRGMHSSKTFGDAFRKALKQTGLEGRWHDLRHTYVALAIKEGAHPKEIQAQLGHRSIVTTLDVYGHLFDSMGRELAARMEQYGAVQPDALLGSMR